ncbi:MAG TPA: phosphoribosyl-AMP cyclohydrolase [bacterium]|jgi:phosphoribosyl-AMP cyclohydrolase|nr:phosphoribosyl-AMP cyclohydrolase [bacterium]HOX87053.1 phosphoribosyl-AMP cyclohydrolase [bacterium]HPG46384.1 phosphoribosyl-AMP cyclohydrolase [bacterium]HPM98702.1 phosphoribosyl-AMP cyclohydrolase [bacterium]
MSEIEKIDQTSWREKFVFDDKGLIPAIIQDYQDYAVLMLGYMNRESMTKTLETGLVTFWSRSRKKLWTKGETSGNFLLVKEILYDCDADALLIKAEAKGPTCHTGERSCFYRQLRPGESSQKNSLEK